MDELFQNLETRIKSLMQKCEELEHANVSLKQSKSDLQREKDALQAKNKMAISHIESILSRLKSIESA